MQTRISKTGLIPLASALAVCVVLILCFASAPFSALSVFFTGAFSSSYYFGTFLNTVCLLLTAALGSSVALKSGNLNLGGEGQIYAGGFVAALVLNAVKGPAVPVFFLALILALLSGAVLASVSAFLKQYRASPVLLTSFLVSEAVIPLLDSAIARHGSVQNLLALPYIPENVRFKSILPPSPLTLSFFVPVILFLAFAYILFKTDAGKKLTLWGIAPQFARYSGFSGTATSFATLSVSGALHSLTGVFAVCGTYYTCHQGFYAGLGWNALTAALIAKANPLTLIPVTLILAWLYTSLDIVSLTQGFGFDISGIIQGVVLFAIALSSFKSRSSR